MLKDHEFSDERVPLGYLITFRSFGTWECGYWPSERSPCVRKGSKRYLWTEKDLDDAIAYVRYEQGESLS
jgi:hypothetical protein